MKTTRLLTQALLVVILTLNVTPVIAAGQDQAVIWSDAVVGTTTRTGSVFGTRCGSGSANATEEANTLALIDDWSAAAGAAGYTFLSPATNPLVGSTGDLATLNFPNVNDVTVTVSRRQVQPSDATNPLSGSTGILSNNASFQDRPRLQDCAPRPANLTSAPTGMTLANSANYSGLDPMPETFWNATTFPAGNALDAALFEFSRPIGAFGLWFGDLETRYPGTNNDEGVLAVVKLLDSSGAVIQSTEILPDEPITNDAICGGTAMTDGLGCGNQASRFIGFVEPTQSVASMLVIVGDDDSCAQTTACNGITEYLSWIGPILAEPQPDLTIDKSLTTTPSGDGDPVEWALTVTNVGGRDAAAGWRVTDVVGAGVSGLNLSGDAADFDCTAITACTGLNPLGAGDSLTLTANGIHTGGFDADIHNAAYVSPAAGDIPEIIAEGTPPAADDDTSATATNNDTNISYQITAPPPPPPTTTTTTTTTPNTTVSTTSTTLYTQTTTTQIQATTPTSQAIQNFGGANQADQEVLAVTGTSTTYLLLGSAVALTTGFVLTHHRRKTAS